MKAKLKDKRYLILAMIVAFILRAIVYFYLCDRTNFNGLMLSTQRGYIDEAMNIVNGEEWFMATFNGTYQLHTNHAKGYSILLALFMLLSPNHYMTIMHLLMMLCDVSVCYFLFDISKRLFKNEKVGNFASWLWALSPVAIFNCIQDLPDGFSCFFIAFVVWLYYQNLTQPIKRYIILGIAMGVANWIRSEFLLLTVVVLICDILREKKLFKVMLQWLVCLVCFFAVMSPWMVYTYQKTGHVILSSTSAWGSAFEAVGEKEDNAWGIVLGDEYVEEIALAQGYDGAWLYDSEQYFKEQFIEYVKENPLEYAEIVLKYRMPKAFVPVQSTYINMNRIYDWNQIVIESENHIFPGLWRLLSRFAAIVSGRAGMLFSFIRFVFMIGFIIESFIKKKFGERSIIIAFWLYFPVIISLLKQVESRNVLTNTALSILAMSYLVVLFMERKTYKK